MKLEIRSCRVLKFFRQGTELRVRTKWFGSWFSQLRDLQMRKAKQTSFSEAKVELPSLLYEFQSKISRSLSFIDRLLSLVQKKGKGKELKSFAYTLFSIHPPPSSSSPFFFFFVNGEVRLKKLMIKNNEFNDNILIIFFGKDF